MALGFLGFFQLKMIKEYEKYNLDSPPSEIFSPASIGKAYLKMMGIKSFHQKNPNFSKEVLGNIMGTYYGGRSEIRVRKEPMEIVLIDFLSMYPTMCILQDLRKFIIADRIEYKDDTDRIREFLDNASLNTLINKDVWKGLTAIVQILPDKDILPFRAKYGAKHTYNIGLPYVESETPLWYTLSDVIASKLLTGKSPKILRAIRFKPIGVQKGLNEIPIVGDKSIDPSKEDLFLSLMKYRHEAKLRKDPIQNIIKIITNATSYGIFVEINTSKRKDTSVTVYGNDSNSFENIKDKVEEFGKAFNPIISTLITSASRLVLAITEAILLTHGKVYGFCDTDSMAVPKEHYKEIQEYFQKISPYPFDDPLFKVEKENFNQDGNIEPLWFYGISAKRYVLYNLDRGNIPHIRKYSLHGLGHILNPFGQNVKNWQENIWYDILNLHYGHIDRIDIDEKYSSLYAISKLSVTSTHVLNRFKIINVDKPFEKQIKPFNFIITGISNFTNPETNELVKPLSQFTKNPQSIVYKPFIDYNSGLQFNGLQFWKPLDSTFWDYVNHLETKFTGENGVLKRRNVKVSTIVYIGKESNNLEETKFFGVSDKSYALYLDKNNILQRKKEFEKYILDLPPRIAIKHGVSRKTLRNWKRNIKKNKSFTFYGKNLKKIYKILQKEKLTRKNII